MFHLVFVIFPRLLFFFALGLGRNLTAGGRICHNELYPVDQPVVRLSYLYRGCGLSPGISATLSPPSSVGLCWPRCYGWVTLSTSSSTTPLIWFRDSWHRDPLTTSTYLSVPGHDWYFRVGWLFYCSCNVRDQRAPGSPDVQWWRNAEATPLVERSNTWQYLQFYLRISPARFIKKTVTKLRLSCLQSCVTCISGWLYGGDIISIANVYITRSLTNTVFRRPAPRVRCPAMFTWLMSTAGDSDSNLSKTNILLIIYLAYYSLWDRSDRHITVFILFWIQ